MSLPSTSTTLLASLRSHASVATLQHSALPPSSVKASARGLDARKKSKKSTNSSSRKSEEGPEVQIAEAKISALRVAAEAKALCTSSAVVPNQQPPPSTRSSKKKRGKQMSSSASAIINGFSPQPPQQDTPTASPSNGTTNSTSFLMQLRANTIPDTNKRVAGHGLNVSPSSAVPPVVSRMHGLQAYQQEGHMGTPMPLTYTPVQSWTPTVQESPTAFQTMAFSSCADPSPTTACPPGTFVVVFDTSSLLVSDPGVMNLACERWVVAISYTVLDEIDGLLKGKGEGDKRKGPSDRTDNGAVKQQARAVREWLSQHSTSSQYSLRVRFQKRTEVVQAYHDNVKTNDDRILGFAIYLRATMPENRVIFVTEDHVLRLKAIAELGECYTYSNVKRELGIKH